MLVPVLAAALMAAPPPPTDMALTTLTDVCLPYVAGEPRDAAALAPLGFVATAADEETRNFQSEDEAYILRLTTTGSAAEENLNRVCVVQARRGGFDGVRRLIQPVLREQGFTAESDLPAGRAIWTRGGVTVSLRQNPGAAAIVRVTFSSLDAD